VSDSAAPDLASFHELEQLVRNLGDELAGFRRRALSAENPAAGARGDESDLQISSRTSVSLRPSRRTRT
jgi:hypothetical protein